MESQNKSKGLYILIGILCILVIILGGYIIYDKVLSAPVENENITNNNQTGNASNTNKTFSKNEAIEVNVGDNLTEKFFVISDNGDNLTLITQAILFETPFYDYSGKDCLPPQQDGSEDTSGCVLEYDKSTLKIKLENYTKDWNNITDIRLLTIEEVESNVYSVNNRWGDHYFYSYNFERFLLLEDNATGSYWLSSKVADDGGSLYSETIYQNDNDIASEQFQLRSGSDFVTESSGVRPVITISKEYVK